MNAETITSKLDDRADKKLREMLEKRVSVFEQGLAGHWEAFTFDAYLKSENRKVSVQNSPKTLFDNLVKHYFTQMRDNARTEEVNAFIKSVEDVGEKLDALELGQ